ncbi:unnamed protein product [Cylindrotheca closterium]|uniref:Uncharacterized protein n=1 Tax=Cylindrotheca closterium TaxID=2856 RepID=A0AAD2JJU5_9STRA|nr:unnamed protein product [Cylindrotheca closterium]
MVIRSNNSDDDKRAATATATTTTTESSKVYSLTNGRCVLCMAFLGFLAIGGLMSSTRDLKQWASSYYTIDPPLPTNVTTKRDMKVPPRKPMSKLHQARAPPKPLQNDKSSRSASNQLHLIHHKELALHDYFSDSWLLPRKNFLDMQLDRIGIVEDACFEAIGKRNPRASSKMFVDWTHFLVEHLSKWWKVLHILDDPDGSLFQHTLQRLESYWHRAVTDAATSKRSPLHETIAMIAFAPYHGKAPGRAEYLTSLSLAATISSIYKVGFGRVVVTGMEDDDEDYVRQAFQLLHNKVHRHTAALNSTAANIGMTELTYVQMTNRSWTTTKWVELNIPRGSVHGMQLALSGQMVAEEQEQWLGSSGTDWKYVDLTEPDTLLHTKSWLLPMMKDGLDSGMSFFPHRLQPLPHELDFPIMANTSATATTKKQHYASFVNEGHYLPGHVQPFSNVTILDEDYSCCDGGGAWVGRMEPFCRGAKEPCGGSMWWSTSLNKPPKDTTDEGILEHYQKLVPYPMMRLGYGTRLVFASTNHGRRCFPSKTPCGNVTYY